MNRNVNHTMTVSYKKPTANSLQMRYFTMDAVREFNMPALLRTYTTNKHDLLTNGYVEWAGERLEEIGNFILQQRLPAIPCNSEEYGAQNNRSVVIFLQSALNGGKGHRSNNFTSHSWRNDVTQGTVMAAFYDPFDEKAQQFASDWVKKNDQETAPNGIYSEFDQRYKIS